MARRPPQRGHLVPLALVLGLSVSLPAAAQQDPDTQSEAASRAFITGSKLFKERRYINAIAAFELAYRLKPHFQVQCSIARCYENLNDMVRAARHYERCLKEGAESLPMAKKVRASLSTVKAQITWVMIHSPGRGGDIFIDGQSSGQAPGRVAVSPGSHIIEVRRAGARTARSTIKTLGGEERELNLTPVDLQPATPVRTSSTVIQTTPPPPPTARRLHPVWFWSGVGVTSALALTAVVLGAQTLGLRSDYENDPTERGYNRFVDRRLVTNVFWALTAAAAGGSTVLFFYTDFTGGHEIRSGASRSMIHGIGLRGSF